MNLKIKHCIKYIYATVLFYLISIVVNGIIHIDGVNYENINSR